MESVNVVKEIVGNDFLSVFDRGNVDNNIINYLCKHKFVIKLDDKIRLLFKDNRKVQNKY